MDVYAKNRVYIGLCKILFTVIERLLFLLKIHTLFKCSRYMCFCLTKCKFYSSIDIQSLWIHLVLRLPVYIYELRFFWEMLVLQLYRYTITLNSPSAQTSCVYLWVEVLWEIFWVFKHYMPWLPWMSSWQFIEKMFDSMSPMEEMLCCLSNRYVY